MHGYVDALLNDFQLILFDARGHGQSDKPHDPSAYTYPLMANDVVAVLDHLDLTRTYYWGFSMGARVGYEMAAVAPDRIDKFILGGAHPYARKATFTACDSSEPQAFLRKFFAGLKVELESVPSDIMALILKNDFKALHAMRQVDRPGVEAGLKALEQSKLLYVGGADPAAAPMREYAALLSDTKLVEIPGLDHSATFRGCDCYFRDRARISCRLTKKNRQTRRSLRATGK